MELVISYRGSLADFDRVEDFEDRVLDLALELHAQATIWRMANDDDPRRMVRGLSLDLCPGQETTSLLVSPAGWLINLNQVAAAQKAQLAEPPWCRVTTQFGPIEGHVALVELLTALKQAFFPNLEVRDEGGYWETRDLGALGAKFTCVQAANDRVAAGLQCYRPALEAAEDPEIQQARIARIVRLVHRTLARPAEHPPVRWDDDGSSFGAEADNDEARWDALYKENRRRQERMHRTIAERLARGEQVESALDAAMLEETSLGLPDEPPVEASDDGPEGPIFEEAEDDEPGSDSLALPWGEDDDNDEDDDFGERARHPLQQRAMDLMLRLGGQFKCGAEAANSYRDVLLHGTGEIMGGLAQALGQLPPSLPDLGLSGSSSDENGPSPYADLPPFSGLAVVQLKRALRGAAFALGALYPLRMSEALDQAAYDELRATVERLQTDIGAELAHLRQRLADEI